MTETDIPMAAPSAVAIIEMPEAFLVEGRPQIEGQLAHSGKEGLFGGHIEPGQTPYDAVRAELDQELGLQFTGPLQLLEEEVVDSQNRHGHLARRHVSLFHVALDDVELSLQVPGTIVRIPKTIEGVEAHRERLTPFAYQALHRAVIDPEWIRPTR